MSILTLPKMVVSAREGWPEVEKSHPSVAKLFALLVLPLSILPPVMLYYAGSHYGDAFAQGFGAKPWGLVAVSFFLAEMATFAAMGWLIKQIAAANEVTVSYYDAYLLAAVSPVPLWLSALGLLVPSLAFNGVLALAALAMSCGLIYHGVFALCHMREEVVATAITYGVIAVGLMAWALLLLFVMLF